MISSILTILTTASTLVLGILLGIAQYRKTQAETKQLQLATNIEDIPNARSPQDSESKILTVITRQLDTAYQRCDKLSFDLDECRNHKMH